MLTGTQLAALLEIDRKTVTNWMNETPPCPSIGTGKARRFRMKDVWEWGIQRERARHEAEMVRFEAELTDDQVKEARDRRVIAESKMAELDLAEREGRVVAAEHVDEVVGEIGERVRAVLINMPSTYVVDLEKLGVTPADGEAVLEKIAGDLTAALRGEDEEEDVAADKAA